MTKNIQKVKHGLKQMSKGCTHTLQIEMENVFSEKTQSEGKIVHQVGRYPSQ